MHIIQSYNALRANAYKLYKGHYMPTRINTDFTLYRFLLQDLTVLEQNICPLLKHIYNLFGVLSHSCLTWAHIPRHSIWRRRWPSRYLRKINIATMQSNKR